MCTESISAFATIAPPSLAASLNPPSETSGTRQAGRNGNSASAASINPQYGTNETAFPTVNGGGETVGRLLHVAA